MFKNLREVKGKFVDWLERKLMGPFIIPSVKVWQLFFVVGAIFGGVNAQVNGWFNAHATFYGADQSPFSLGKPTFS